MGEKGAGRSQAKITDKEILEILKKKGKVKIFEQDFKYFTTGKSDIEGHKERVFLCEVFSNNKKEVTPKVPIVPDFLVAPSANL